MLNIENCSAKIMHVNARKELNGEEFRPAFDLKISMRVLAECYRGLLPDYDDFLRLIWNENKELRNVNIKKIEFHDVAFVEGMFLIKDKFGNTTQYDNCKVNSFKFYPGNFQIATLDFRIQYSADDENEIVPVYKAEQHEGILLTIKAKPKDKPENGDKDDQKDLFASEEDRKEEEPEED